MDAQTIREQLIMADKMADMKISIDDLLKKADRIIATCDRILYA